MKFSYFLFTLPILFLASCSDQNQNGKNSDSSAIDSLKKVDTVSDWHTLTESWTSALNMKNSSIMKSFYSDSVFYYGDKISGEVVVKRQQSYFSANPDYHMKIVDYIGEEQQPDGNWRVRITKQVLAGGKTADYPASLVYAKRNGIWKIIAESDDITDLKKAQKLVFHYGMQSETIIGWLEENTGFGPSKEGDPKSDAKEFYYAVWPIQPLDVLVNDNQEKGVTQSEHDIDRVQLLGDKSIIAPFLNKKVQITGTFSHATTPHHFTKVLLSVIKIEEAK